MDKQQIPVKTFIYPMPIFVIGAMLNGKPNYATIAYCGIVNHMPPMLSVALRKSHYTNFGIAENGTFSLNLPSQDMIKVVDYCGLVSGSNTDKSKLFDFFQGSLKSTPIIKDCPLNLECKVLQKIEFDMRVTYIAEIVNAYCEEKYLTNGLPDIKKMKPLVFSMHDNTYWAVGDFLGKAWNIGQDYMPE